MGWVYSAFASQGLSFVTAALSPTGKQMKEVFLFLLDNHSNSVYNFTLGCYAVTREALEG